MTPRSAKRPWLPEDFALLKKLRSQNKSLRDIACALSRSVTSINKVLGRSGIRPFRAIDPKRPRLFCHEARQAQWVPWPIVLTYVRCHAQTFVLIPFSETPYLINGLPCSSLRALMWVNQRRCLNEKVPTWRVPEITWE